MSVLSFCINLFGFIFLVLGSYVDWFIGFDWCTLHFKFDFYQI